MFKLQNLQKRDRKMANFHNSSLLIIFGLILIILLLS